MGTFSPRRLQPGQWSAKAMVNTPLSHRRYQGGAGLISVSREFKDLCLDVLITLELDLIDLGLDGLLSLLAPVSEQNGSLPPAKH